MKEGGQICVIPVLKFEREGRVALLDLLDAFALLQQSDDTQNKRCTGETTIPGLHMDVCLGAFPKFRDNDGIQQNGCHGKQTGLETSSLRGESGRS